MVMTASDNVRGREGKNQSQENWEKSTRSFSNVKNHLEGVVLGSSRDQWLEPTLSSRSMGRAEGAHRLRWGKIMFYFSFSTFSSYKHKQQSLALAVPKSLLLVEIRYFHHITVALGRFEYYLCPLFEHSKYFAYLWIILFNVLSKKHIYAIPRLGVLK